MHGVREFELAKRLLYYKATLERGMNVMHQVFADELSFLIEAWDGSNLGSASRDVIPLTETMRRGFIAFLLDLEERVRSTSFSPRLASSILGGSHISPRASGFHRTFRLAQLRRQEADVASGTQAGW